MTIIVGVLLLLLPSFSGVSNQASSQKFDEYGMLYCDDELARLDNYAIQLQLHSNAKGHVIVYGGRNDTWRNQIRDRLSRIKKYLTTNRRIDGRRIVLVNGGYRESFTVELWVVGEGEEPPETKPTVERKSVKFRGRERESDCTILYQ